MAETKITEIVETTDHPLEDFFGIEPNSTEVVRKEVKTELIKPAEYDEKDIELEEGYQTIYDEAMTYQVTIKENLEDIDPKYAARNVEVAGQMLMIALNAMKERADLKKHKDKLVNSPKGNMTTNQTIVIDTNSLINQLKKPKTIDVKSEPVEVTEVTVATEDNKK